MNEVVFQIGDVVEWGPADYPRSGVLRYFTSDGGVAFVEDARKVFTRVLVRELRPPADVEEQQ